MKRFDEFKIKKQLMKALDELGFEEATPIQEASFPAIMGGADYVGIAQTGTGKTVAYLLPILQDLAYSDQRDPRVLILVPTRELVLQIVAEIEKLTAYVSVRTVGVYGGTANMKKQALAVDEGADILVGTPRRVYDLVLANHLRLKAVRKLVVDEVDIMLDFGFKTQLKNIFDYLPAKRQNILFSATMTTYVEELMADFLVNPTQKTMAVSGTPLENISQECYPVPNFYTKANLLNDLLADKEAFEKVLVFVGSKTSAELLFETLDDFAPEMSLIHAGKEQNYRVKSVESFRDGSSRILIATDVMARGVDIDKISTVISFDTPRYPENYIHRIGRTGRAGEEGRAILLYTEKEVPLKEDIEKLMNYTIPEQPFPEHVEVNGQLTPEEKDRPVDLEPTPHDHYKHVAGPSFHEKSAKNSKQPAKKKSYQAKLKETYKKPIRKGDKIQNMKKKRKRK